MDSFGASDDAQLWERSSSEPAAFGVLFERHADAVYNHCFRRTASWSLADDLTSSVFLDAWRRRRDVRLVDDSVLPWLLAVANNAIRNQQRALRRQRRLLIRVSQPDIEFDPVEDIVDRVDSEAQMKQLLSAIHDLSAQEQDVLSMCVWAGLDYAAVAQALDIPIGTVRSRLSRARSKLRVATGLDAVTRSLTG